MEGSLDPDKVINSLSDSHATFVDNMSALVDLVDVYRRRTEMLEAQIQMLANQNNVLNKQNETLRSLLVGQRLLRGRDVYTQTETAEDDPIRRVERRTISESGVQMSWESQRVHPDSPDIWDCAYQRVPKNSDDWCGPLSSSSSSNWDTMLNKSSTLDSDYVTDSSGILSHACSHDSPSHINDDDFDLNEINEALRESQLMSPDNWETAGGKTIAKKEGRPPSQKAKRVKFASESSVSSKKPAESKRPLKNIVATLPSAFLGHWYLVKSCVTGGKNDGRWKEVSRKGKGHESRVSFHLVPSKQTVNVVHKKFIIRDATFYEHCGGQRCILLKDRPNCILIRNKEFTHTFAIVDDKLVETFKDGPVEYKHQMEKIPLQ